MFPRNVGGARCNFEPKMSEEKLKYAAIASSTSIFNRPSIIAMRLPTFINYPVFEYRALACLPACARTSDHIKDFVRPQFLLKAATGVHHLHDVSQNDER